jgi:O-acetyl-ADP-ribose deacetylase (regulator of RNase III)
MTQIRAFSGDITTVACDAIVNAANSRLEGGGGVDGAIHAAGGPIIFEECQAWVRHNGELHTGGVMLTDAGNLPARHVIHTVGPVWGDDDPDESRRLLGHCYRNSLDLAAANGLTSVAFPNISTGVFGFPKQPAAEVAIFTVTSWAESNGGVDEVSFVCFDEESLTIYSGLLVA